MDSDRRKKIDPLNDTKLRVLAEIESAKGYCWVTAGREIENYIHADVMTAALTEMVPTEAVMVGKAPYGRAYGENGKVDKLRLAKLSTANVNLDVLDLRERIEGLVSFIRASNE